MNMKTKKQLDRLFKEQFKNMDVTPPPAVWENIATALQNSKKPKRVVPLWYKLAGVAATLLLLLGVGSIFFTGPGDTLVTFEDPATPHNPEIIQPAGTPQDITDTKQNDVIVDQSNEVPEENNTPPKDKNLLTYQEEQKQISSDRLTASETISQKDKTPETDAASAIKENIAHTTQTGKTIITEPLEKEQVPEKEISITETETVIADSETTEENKKSIIDYIAQRESEEPVTVSTAPENRWEVSPNFAPVYYNSLGSGSSIDPQFSNNPKSGEINYSYGIQVSYAINERLSVRTGINKVDLSYSTNNIEYAIADAAEGLRAINYQTHDYIVMVGTSGSLSHSTSNYPTVTEDGVPIVPRLGIIPGTMKQELDYFEVPLELKYSLSNNRLGINIIGGMSTLLLNNNQISVHSDGFQSEIGSANNLNTLSFSTNVGLGLDYKFSSRFIFNLEPMFKYQLNTYSDSAIDFKPFFLGVYSGFSYKF